MEEEIQRTVAEAATILDADKPDWFTHVDKETLSLTDPGKCVIGQGYAPYYPGLFIETYERLGINANLDQAFAGWCGDEGDVLAKGAWFAEIDKRREGA